MKLAQRISLMFLLSIFTIIGLSNTVFAEGTYTNFPETNVSPLHEFTITFNLEVDGSTINDENIYVMTDNQEVVNGTMAYQERNKKSVKVLAPKEGYKVGKTYFLHVENGVKTVDGKELKNPVKMKFTIKGEKTIIDGVYVDQVLFTEDGDALYFYDYDSFYFGGSWGTGMPWVGIL